MINLNEMPFVYWDDITKISYLQRRIIIYSLMYYKLNESCISDKEYDKISSELVKLQNESNFDSWKHSDYYYCMYDFDGTTGFDIPDRLNNKDKKYLMNLAKHILKQNKGEVKWQ